MPDTYFVEDIPDLGAFGNVVPEGYTYTKKLVTPGQDLSLPNAAHPHFPWCRFRAQHTAAVGQNRKCQFLASTTESDDEPIKCALRDPDSFIASTRA
jgi:hypothetical protein